MSINLQKGQKVSLSKEKDGLSKIVVGLGWDEAKGYGQQSIDCDAFAIMLKEGRIIDAKDIIYFNNLSHYTGSVRHMGDNLTGAGEGDDEQIVIDLDSVPTQYDSIIIAVNIYQAKSKSQHFGMIKNAFIRLVDARNNKEICIYNLTENYFGKTAMIFGKLYRSDNEWKFSAIGDGTYDGSVFEVAAKYGLTVNNTATPSGGCYVATAVYGYYDCPQVWTLRRYRDHMLAKKWYGRIFIRAYYAFSPTLVKIFGNTEWFKKIWRKKLDRMVSDLNSSGVENTPYQDINILG